MKTEDACAIIAQEIVTQFRDKHHDFDLWEILMQVREVEVQTNAGLSDLFKQIIAKVVCEIISTNDISITPEEVFIEITELRSSKNTDYGEAWRHMRVSSIIDLMLAKVLRINQIKNLNGKTLVSENEKAGYQDIINYAMFCLILLQEKTQ